MRRQPSPEFQIARHQGKRTAPFAETGPARLDENGSKSAPVHARSRAATIDRGSCAILCRRAMAVTSVANSADANSSQYSRSDDLKKSHSKSSLPLPPRRSINHLSARLPGRKESRQVDRKVGAKRRPVTERVIEHKITAGRRRTDDDVVTYSRPMVCVPRKSDAAHMNTAINDFMRTATSTRASCNHSAGCGQPATRTENRTQHRRGAASSLTVPGTPRSKRCHSRGYCARKSFTHNRTNTQ